MNAKRRLLAATLLGTALAMGGCANLGEKSAGQTFDDTAITAKVKAKFVADKEVSALDIKVDTYKGTVQLSGFAQNYAEVERAARLAREVNGVREVKNDIRLASK